MLSVDLHSLSVQEQFKHLERLHKKFGHFKKDKFRLHLKSAGALYKGAEGQIDKLIDGCEGCLIKNRNPDRPKVEMPMASEFNVKLAIDLKIMSDKKLICHMVDMWSCLSKSVRMTRKDPKEVINIIMINWTAYYGLPGAIHNNNGGKFTVLEIKEVKAVLNVIDLMTGAESPWQNNICEKNHQIIDDMFIWMKNDFPETEDEVLLAWANMAKNSMQMVYGCSPNQLVFGVNPKLPNILTKGIPALQGRTFSETLATHLDTLSAAKKAFMESENSSRLRKALRSKICTNITIYYHGDNVW